MMGYQTVVPLFYVLRRLLSSTCLWLEQHLGIHSILRPIDWISLVLFASTARVK